jgi:hypothetical protein
MPNQISFTNDLAKLGLMSKVHRQKNTFANI